MKFGVISNVLGTLTVDETARLLSTEGFDGVQLALDFADVTRICPGSNLRPLTKKLCRRISLSFKEEGLEILALSADVNLIESNKATRFKHLSYFRKMLRVAPSLNCRLVVTESGFRDSLGASQSEAAWQCLIDSVSQLAPVAEEENVLMVVRPGRTQTVSSAFRARQLIKQVGSPNLKLSIDPASLLFPETIDEMFELMIPNLVAAHARDVLVSSEKDGNGATVAEHPRAGKGQLNYPRFLRMMSRHLPCGPLILDGVNKDNFGEARDFVRRMMDQANAESGDGVEPTPA